MFCLFQSAFCSNTDLSKAVAWTIFCKTVQMPDQPYHSVGMPHIILSKSRYKGMVLLNLLVLVVSSVRGEISSTDLIHFVGCQSCSFKDNTKVTSLAVPQLNACAAECAYNERCIGFGYNGNTAICDIYSGNSGIFGEALFVGFMESSYIKGILVSLKGIWSNRVG